MATRQTDILNTKFRNASDIDSFFKNIGSKDFVDWFNTNHARKGFFDKMVDPSGRIRHSSGPLNVANRWQNVWNEINVLFNKPEINLVEFVALNTIMINESPTFKASSEYYGTKGFNGISYTYSKIKGTKRSYNTLSDAGNKTCFVLFNDPVYIKEFGNKKFGNIYKKTTDNRWATDIFPPGNTSKETTGESTFISEADFHKFRGRGFIQTTGRANYVKIIKFILDYAGNNPTIIKVRNTWRGKVGNNIDKIATISSNKEWDDLFQNTNNIIPSYALWGHAERTKYSWITPTDDERKLRNDTRNVASKIAGAGAKAYQDIYEGRVFQLINSILGDETPFQETTTTDTNGANDSTNGQSEEGQIENGSGSDSNSPSNQSSELPKIEGLTNFFKPTIELPPITFETGKSQAHSEKIKNTLGYMPYVSYNNLQIEPAYIIAFSLSVQELLPTVNITFDDQWGMMGDNGTPLDDSKITIFISSRTTALKSIFMQFKITSFSNVGSTYILSGVANINKMFIRTFESYANMSSFECLQEFAKRAGLGFNSNVSNSDDKMTWINPNMNGMDFVKDVISKSYRNDSAFVWVYIDPYYNLNYIDVEEALKIDIKSDIGIHTIGLNNVDGINDKNKVTDLVLTNDNSMADSNNYFDKWSLVNNSTSISLNKGYLNKVKFYDINTLNFLIFDIDSITSEGDKTIIMKGSPQDESFYKEHISTTYAGKIDTDNSHKNYNYSIIQNKQNIEDIQKIAIKIEMPSPNFNLYRFQKVNIVITNKVKTPAHELINYRMSGEWLIIDVKYTQIDAKFKQLLTLVKRDLNLSPEELKNENPASPSKSETTISENTTNPEPEAIEPATVTDDATTNTAVTDDATTNTAVEGWSWELEWANSTEIENFFLKLNPNGFTGWFNDQFKENPLFSGGDTNINKERWTKIWNSINLIYDNKDSVNSIEYLALNTLIYTLVGSEFKPVSESKTLQEFFTIYNTSNLNINAFTSFNNNDYNVKNNNKPFISILKNTTDTNWSTNIMPIGFSGGDINKEISVTNNDYITNLDFYKFRRRGYVPIIGRKGYRNIVEYINDSPTIVESGNPLLKKIKEEWDSVRVGGGVVSIATISTNEQWDSILLDDNINPVLLSSIWEYFFNKNEQHIFSSNRSEDKVLRSIGNIGRAIKSDIPDFDVDKYIKQVKEQIYLLDGNNITPPPTSETPPNNSTSTGWVVDKIRMRGSFNDSGIVVGWVVRNDTTVGYYNGLVDGEDIGTFDNLNLAIEDTREEASLKFEDSKKNNIP